MTKSNKPESMPPTLHLSSKDLSALKDWEIGKKYRIALEVKQTSKNQYEDEPVSASFEILKAKAIGESDEDKDLFGDYKDPNRV